MTTADQTEENNAYPGTTLDFAYGRKTVTTNAWMLEELLCDFIDPNFLLIPYEKEHLYWGDVNDHGISIDTNEHETVAFIPWPVLRDIVDEVRGIRINSVSTVGMRYRNKVKRIRDSPK